MRCYIILIVYAICFVFIILIEKVGELLKIFPQKEQVYLVEKLDQSSGSIEEAVISILNEQCKL
jgi:hypothetical protein